MEIDVTNIATAHELVVARIMHAANDEKSDLCREIKIETSPGKWEWTWEYRDLVTTIIRQPQLLPQVSEACSFGPGFISQYKEDLCHLKLRSEYPPGKAPVYTYPWRLMDYPVDDESGVLGNGDGLGLNQIEQIIKRLQQNPDSRRGNAITWVPTIDGEATHDQPCLQVAHFMIRSDITNPALHGRFFFRSHDMLGGAGANWVGLCGLMELVAERLDVEVGSLTTCSSSAHLYWKRDEDDLKKFKKHLFEKYRMYL